MLAGEMYMPWDAELTKDRIQAKEHCFQLNQTSPTQTIARQDIIRALFSMTDEAWIESPFHCDYGYNIRFGKGFYINHGCTLLDAALITFGDNCLLAPGVVISTAGHPLDATERASGLEFAKAITIGNDVWFGANVTVCPGVTIGNNVVIGAGSVVTKDLPSNTVCVGSPAKVIREIE
ncbi:sugar O-acetyltransferase [Marinomonas sp. 15G1-11]|uniref:Acetyltransferase n=2 Tax=Marinomonas phaeophyticola TaxID=3004091 RepID=A0ABT4JXM4_9GAMM|nr:sugar O-acetyltransferase [Marinomonas sp. 15G1-11]